MAIAPGGAGVPLPAATAPAKATPGFGEALTGAVQKVSDAESHADSLLQKRAR